ncbi:MAG: hypothetical protein ACI9S6_000969, partial [Reinekea sp.]
LAPAFTLPAKIKKKTYNQPPASLRRVLVDITD